MIVPFFWNEVLIRRVIWGVEGWVGGGGGVGRL